MFFLLSKQNSEKGKGHWNQLGIVIADNAKEAAEKIDMEITNLIERTEGKY
ncbi:MAG: hypothetical protein HQ536_03255, partial [Parcubacteria group bacterium]|nr:hypothetical protein [Parcubacteria group bacterium]